MIYRLFFVFLLGSEQLGNRAVEGAEIIYPDGNDYNYPVKDSRFAGGNISGRCRYPHVNDRCAGRLQDCIFLYPDIEYCRAAGMSFVTTDSKDGLYGGTAAVAEKNTL